AEFFTEDAVFGKGRRDSRAEQLLRLAIGDRDGRRIGLEFDAQVVAAKILERELACLARDVHREFEPRSQVGVLGHADYVARSALSEMSLRHQAPSQRICLTAV